MEDIETKILEHKSKIKKLNDQLNKLKDKNDFIILNIQIKGKQDIIIALLELLNKHKTNNKLEIKNNLENEIIEETGVNNTRIRG